MSVLGGSDSATKQTVNNSQQSASDQAINIRARVLGDNRSGNSTIKVGRGGVYNPTVTYTTQGYSAEDLDRITSSFNQSVSAAITGLGQQRQLEAGKTLPDVIEDRLGEQITNAPADAAQEKRNLLIIVVAMLAIAGGALLLGRKK